MAKLLNYKGSVELASGLRPKNNGDFPLMEAHDVLVNEQGARLDDILGKTYIKTVSQSNWEAVSAIRYKIKIPQSELGLSKPYIDNCIVDLNNGVREKAILDMLELVDGDVVIYSNVQIDCKIILKGE